MVHGAAAVDEVDGEVWEGGSGVALVRRDCCYLCMRRETRYRLGSYALISSLITSELREAVTVIEVWFHW